MNYISSNFVVWAWDMTHDTNRARFAQNFTLFRLKLCMVVFNFGKRLKVMGGLKVGCCLQSELGNTH